MDAPSFREWFKYKRDYIPSEIAAHFIEEWCKKSFIAGMEYQERLIKEQKQRQEFKID